MLLSLWAVVLEEVSFQRYRRFGDLGRLLLFATLENFGYRQRTVWWRLKAFWSVFRQKQTWGEMTRKGFESAGKQASEPAKANSEEPAPGLPFRRRDPFRCSQHTEAVEA